MSQQKAGISYRKENVRFSFQNKYEISKWLNSIAKKHGKKIARLHFVFVSDDFLLNLNRKFLRHNTLTDIITFDYCENEKNANLLEGEIYISIDRIIENSKLFKVQMNDELHRVMAHGLLHLIGFGDKSLKEKSRMRVEEKNALDLRQF